jgi:F-type H+-transporting ATPase subunit b
MSRGVWVGGLVLALVVALPAALARAEGDPADGKAEDATIEKAREAIREELRKPKPDYEEIEHSLVELLQKARQQEAGAALPTDAISEGDLRAQMDKAVSEGKYDLAAYYLDRIKLQNEKPNIFGWALDLTIWTIVVFLVLLFILGRFAWTPMLQGLEKREHDIHAAIEDARKAREEAQRLREDVQSERNKIEDMRRDILQKAQADAQRMADEITTKAKAQMQAERDRLRRDMETAHDQALQDLFAQTVDLAALVSSKAMRREMTPDDHRRFVDEALADIRQAGNGKPTTAGV